MDILTYKLKDIKVIEISARTIRFKAEDVLSLLNNTYFHEFDCIILYRENLAEDFYLKSIKIPKEEACKRQQQVRIAIVGNHAEPIRGMERFIKELALPEKIIFADTPFQALEKVK